MKLVVISALAFGAVVGCASQDADAPPATDDTAAAETAAPAASGITDSSTTREVHDAYIIPGSNALFAAERTPPETDEDWAALAAAAQQVIDGSNLLMQGNRPPGSSDWLMHAGAVVDATKVTQTDAIEAQVADEFVFTNGDMMAGCTACHQQFRNP